MTSFLDRLFVNAVSRLSLRTPQRAADHAAELASRISTDLHLVLAEIDRQHRLLAVQAERAATFVEEYSYDLPVLPEAEVMIAGLDSAHADIRRMREQGLDGLSASDRAEHACLAAGWTMINGAILRPGASWPDSGDLARARAEIAELHKEIAQNKATDARLRKALDIGAQTHAQRTDSQLTAISREIEALKLSSAEAAKLSTSRLVHMLIRAYQTRANDVVEAKHKLAAVKEIVALHASIVKELENTPLRATQQSISKWAHDTFGECTVERAAGRAVEEMSEFRSILDKHAVKMVERKATDGTPLGELNMPQRIDLMKEAADVVVCLYRMAELMGTDLHAEIDRVMQINHGRTWKRDGKGCGYHVKQPTPDDEQAQRERMPADIRRSRLTRREIRQLVIDERNGDPGAHAKLEKILASERFKQYVGGLTRPGMPDDEPAFFPDETKTVSSRELYQQEKRLVDLERWHGLLRESTERLTEATLGKGWSATVLDHIGTPQFGKMIEEIERRAGAHLELTTLLTAIRTDLLPTLVSDELSPDPDLAARARTDPLGGVRVVEAAAKLLRTYQTVRREDRAALDSYAQTVNEMKGGFTPRTQVSEVGPAIFEGPPALEAFLERVRVDPRAPATLGAMYTAFGPPASFRIHGDHLRVRVDGIELSIPIHAIEMVG